MLGREGEVKVIFQPLYGKREGHFPLWERSAILLGFYTTLDPSIEWVIKRSNGERKGSPARNTSGGINHPHFYNCKILQGETY